MPRAIPAALILAVGVACRAFASISLQIDKLDASDALPMPPSYLVVVDISVGISADDAWGSGSLFGLTSSGAELYYATDELGRVIPTAPGTENRFVTFLSMPRGRDDDARFGPGATPELWGSAGGPPLPIFQPSQVSVVWGDPPPPALGVEGFIARVAIDLRNVTDPAFRVDSPSIVVALTQPADSVLLFDSSGPPQGGTNAAAYSNQSVRVDWGIYGIIPEPATGVLALLAAITLLRRG